MNLDQLEKRVKSESSSLGKSDELAGEIRNAVTLVREALPGFPFPPSVEGQMRRLLQGADDLPRCEGLHHSLRELLNGLMDELNQQVFLFVRPELARYYYYENAPESFGEAVSLVFPDSVKDIRSAARCLAHEEWTAVVFHLMRAVEHALTKWATQLGVSLAVPVSDANWQELLNAAQRKCNELRQTSRAQRPPTWQADLTYFSESLVFFQGIKDGWRNFVSHRAVTYDEQEACEVFGAVRSFMRKLAAGPH